MLIYSNISINLFLLLIKLNNSLIIQNNIYMNINNKLFKILYIYYDEYIKSLSKIKKKKKIIIIYQMIFLIYKEISKAF